jgi:small subunit ribosomal protein S8
MSMTDPLADMLTRIRNAGSARLEKVQVPSSKIKDRLAEILVEEGFLSGHRKIDDSQQGIIELELRYDTDKRLVIRKIERISKPGRRVYAKCDEIPKIKNGLGVCIVSTSQGVMTDKEARRRRIGGELVCQVW